MTGIEIALLISSIAGGLSQVAAPVVGGMMNAKETNAARDEARNLDKRDWAETVRQNRFGETMSKEQLALSKESLGLSKDRFGLETSIAMYGVNKDMIGRVENVVNKNMALKDRLLQRWGV